MIQIQQNLPNIDGLDILVNVDQEIEIDIDTVALDSDIQSLNEKLLKPLSKTDKKNLMRVKDYISRFKNKTKDGKFEMLWQIDECILKAYPLELLHIPEYNIEMTDYIKVTNGNLVRINYRDVLEIIAFEIMYRDFGETMATMENKLGHLGITGIHPSCEIQKFIEDSPYDMSKIFKIGSSPYYASDLDVTFEYFGTKKFESEYYRPCVEYSAKHALAIITKKILSRFMEENIGYKLFAVSDSGIYLNISSSNIDNIENIILNESVVVRAFGRYFEVKPEITIF